MKAAGFIGLFCAALYLAPTTSNAMTYDFEFIPMPYAGLLTISGFFTGSDSVLVDNTISQDEVSDWEVSLNPGVSGFEQFSFGSATGDLLDFGYDIASGELTLQVLNFNNSYISADSFSMLFSSWTGESWSGLTEQVTVTPRLVPVPAAAWLLGSALLAIGGLIRRQNRWLAGQ